MQNLNETANSYLNNNPIEEELSKFSNQIVEKIDNVASNLENELHLALSKKYPKYAASLPYSSLNSKVEFNLIHFLNYYSYTLTFIIF